MQGVFLPKMLLLLLQRLPPQDNPAPRGGVQPPYDSELQGSGAVMQKMHVWGALTYNPSKYAAVKELCGAVLGIAGLSFCDCQDEERQQEDPF